MRWRVISGVQIVVRNTSKPWAELRPELEHREHSGGTEVAITVLVWGLRDWKHRKHLGSSFSSNDGDSRSGAHSVLDAILKALYRK